MKIQASNKKPNTMFKLMLLTIVLLLSGATSVAQNTKVNSDKLKLFEGEWTLKDNIWKSKSNGVYQEDVNPNRTFTAKAVSPKNTILWEADFDHGSWATLLWTYHTKTGRVNHISNTSDNNVGIGTGEFNNNNDLTIKIVYPNGCTNCHRIYSYHWINPDAFEFNATIYKDDKPTGDFYGATFLKKIKKTEAENRVKFVEIGVNVSDTIRSLAFYTKIFGMKHVGTWHASKELTTSAGVNNGKPFDVLNLRLNCNDYVLKYKLAHTENISNTTNSYNFKYYGFEKPGLGYLTFNVENSDAYLKRITENNIVYKLVTLPNGRKVILLHDPDGYFLEIIGP